MRTWTVKIPGMARERAAELKYFCLQYPVKKARLAALRGGFNAFALDGQPHGSGRAGRPTETRALRAAQSKDARDVAEIERAAREVTGSSAALYKCLMSNVTRGERLEAVAPPMGRNQYYALRRSFFRALDRIQQERDTGALDG